MLTLPPSRAEVCGRGSSPSRACAAVSVEAATGLLPPVLLLLEPLTEITWAVPTPLADTHVRNLDFAGQQGLVQVGQMSFNQRFRFMTFSDDTRVQPAVLHA